MERIGKNMEYYFGDLKPNQIKAIELLATKGIDHNMTSEEIAEECGVHRKTLWMWRKERAFNDALISFSKEINRSAIPQILSRLTREIETASARDVTNIAKLLLQVHGELTEKTESTVHVEADINSIKERLKKYKKD